MLAIPPVDFVLHNSEFVVAHFHNVIIGGTVFGSIAGFIYWFPKVFGFRLHEKLGKISFWLFLSGFIITFTPLYILSFMGMTRRLHHYNNSAWQMPMWIAMIGVIILGIAIVVFITQIIVSFIQKKQLIDCTGDPWDGRTLEWSLPSPVPHYNFAHIPIVSERDEFWHRKQQGTVSQQSTQYQDIMMPKNKSAGILVGMATFIFGFAMVWHIWWMAMLGLLGMMVTLVVYLASDDIYYVISAEEVKKTEETFNYVR